MQGISQLRRSQSHEKKPTSSAKKPPLPPGHIDSSKKLRQSQTEVVTTTTTTVPGQPTIIEQRRVTTPVLIPAPSNEASVVVSTLRSSRPSSSHGLSGNIVRVSSRPGSSHGIPTTVRPMSSHGLGGSRVIVTTTTTPAITTVPMAGAPIITRPPIIGPPTVEVRPGRIGIDTRPTPLPAVFGNGLVKRQSGIGATTYSADSTRIINQPDGTALIQNLKKELTIETKPITPPPTNLFVQSPPYQYQTGYQAPPVTFVYSPYSAGQATTLTQPAYSSPPVQTYLPPQSYQANSGPFTTSLTSSFNGPTAAYAGAATYQAPSYQAPSYQCSQPFSFRVPQPSASYNSLAPPMQYVSPYLQQSQPPSTSYAASLASSSNLNSSGNVPSTGLSGGIAAFNAKSTTLGQTYK